MSIEAIGQNGAVLGSDMYWNQLNSNTILGGLMQWASGTEYYRTLQETATRASTAIEEIYDDLQQNIDRICLVPSSPRDTLAKQVESLYNVCEMAGILNRHSQECQRILELREPSASIDPFVESALQTAHQKIRKCTDFLPTECIDLAKEAATWGVSSAAGGDQKKLALLTDISQGKGESFLKLVADTYETSGPIREVQGACGYAIGSSGYLNHIERIVFPQGLSRAYGVTSGSPDYAGALRSGIHSIADQLQADLEQNTRDNNYITDSTEKRLTEAISDLSRCGISTFSFDVKIKGLAWYVGGDPGKIQQLQSLLNRLNMGEPLKEDGVYGRKTLTVFENFLSNLEHGTVPNLKWIDPLKTTTLPFSQSEQISLGIASTKSGLNNAIKNTTTGFYYFHIDSPHFYSNGAPKPGYYRGSKVSLDYNHINVDFGENPTALQAWLQKQYNHQGLDDFSYNHLKDLKNTGKVVRTAGKVLLVAGIALDALELGLTVYDDLHDADQKLGKKTLSTTFSIGGRWAGAAAGAQAGAFLGGLTGPAAPVAIPILSLVGGIAGSFGGDWLGKYVVDITYVE